MAVLTSVDDVQQFLNRDSLESDLEVLRKDELLLIAEYGDLEVRSTMKKQEVKEIVMEYLGFNKDTGDNEGEDLGNFISDNEDGESCNKDGGKSKTVKSESDDRELEKLRLEFQLKQLEWDREREREKYEERKRKEEREHEERVKEREREHEKELKV